MLIPKRWNSRAFILCCGFLLLIAGCGLSEMFGGSDAEKITEPCLELIPSPTPIPVITVTPLSENTPESENSCNNAPGIVLICDEEPVETPIIVITPPPEITETPLVSYTIHVELIVLDTICAPSTLYPITPPGSTLPPTGYDIIVSAGTIQQFIVTTSSMCQEVSVFQSPPGSSWSVVNYPSVSVNIGPVNQNLSVLLYISYL